MRKITYRQALTKDANLLSALFRQVYMATYATEGITHEFVNFVAQQFSIEKIKEDINNKNSDLWIALHNNNPIAVLQSEYNSPCPIRSELRIEINKLYVLQCFHGKKIGQQLMKFAEERIQSKGEKCIWLWVLKSNLRAVRFYQQQGYKEIGTAYFQMEVNQYNNIVMQKQL